MSDEYDYDEMPDERLWAMLETTDGLEKYRILAQLAHNRIHDDEYLQALAIAQQAADYARAQGLTQELGNSLHMAGYLHHRVNQPTEAIACYTEAGTIMHLLGIDSGAASIEGSMGEAFWHVKDYQNAALHYEVAFNLYDSIDQHNNASMAAWDYADAMLRLGRLNYAITWFGKALEHGKKSEDSHRLYRAYRGLARSYLFIDDGGRAVENAKKALTIAETCSCRHCGPESHLLLGRSHRLNGDLRAAKGHIEIASKIYKEQSNMRCQAYCEYELGAVALAKFYIDEAEVHLNKALTFTEMFDDSLFTFKVLVAVARTSLCNGKDDKAISKFDEAYEIAKDVPFLRSLKHEMLLDYFGVLERMKDGRKIRRILKDISKETDSWLLPECYRIAFSSRAHLLLGDNENALRFADQGLLLPDTETPDECTAAYHHARAEAIRSLNPQEAQIEMHKAIGYYLQSGNGQIATELANEWVVEPDRKMREQNRFEESRNKYEEIYLDADPIERQIHDERDLTNQYLESLTEDDTA